MSAGVLLALAGLGAFHGLNPGMGWLFAVSLGLQERSRGALLRALGPIALGHFASVAAISIAVAIGMSSVTTTVVAVVGGLLLVGAGLWHVLSRRHFRWVGMRLNAWQLMFWSFLVASVHGAGLMLVPVLTSGGSEPPAHHPAPESVGVAAELTEALLTGTAAAGLHTAATAVVAGILAVVVYESVGVRILRTAWVNLDGLWAMALLAAGVLTVVTAVV